MIGFSTFVAFLIGCQSVISEIANSLLAGRRKFASSRREQLGYQVGTVLPHERQGYALAVGLIVPEKVLPLGELGFGCGGGIDGLKGVGMNPAVVYLARHCHRRGGEVLHLLQMHVEVLGLYREFGHVDLLTSGVG